MKLKWFLAISCAFMATQSASQNAGDANQRWGPELVYAEDIGYRPCGNAADTPACLRDLGLSEEAIAFSYAIENDYSGATVGISFRELGRVDLVEARFIGNTVYHFPILVNGQPGLQVIPLTRDLSRSFQDSTSQAMLRRFPRAASRGPGRVTAHRMLPDGTQRFVLADTIVDGCRACPVLGTAISFFEITPNGSSQRRPIGLQLSALSEHDETAAATQISPRELQRRPTSIQARLNLLGYEAGPMDGVIGTRTQAALSQFKADHCMPANARLNNETAQHLLDLDGFALPCGTDVGQGADTSSLSGSSPPGVSGTRPRSGGTFTTIRDAINSSNITAEDLAALIDTLRTPPEPATPDAPPLAELPYDESTRDEIFDYAQGLNTIRDGIDSLSEGWLSRESTAFGVSWWEVYGDLLAAERVVSALEAENPSRALLEIDKWAGHEILSRTQTGSTIMSSFQIASVAALPIELALDEFLNLVNSNSYNYQRHAYFLARDSGLEHHQIMDAENRLISAGSHSFFIGELGFFTQVYENNRRLGINQRPLKDRGPIFSLLRLEYEVNQIREDLDRSNDRVLDATVVSSETD